VALRPQISLGVPLSFLKKTNDGILFKKLKKYTVVDVNVEIGGKLTQTLIEEEIRYLIIKIC